MVDLKGVIHLAPTSPRPAEFVWDYRTLADALVGADASGGCVDRRRDRHARTMVPT